MPLMTDAAPLADDVRRALSVGTGPAWLRRLALLGALAAVVGVGLVVRARNRPVPPARYVTAELTRGDIAEKVQATGAVQPVLQVNVSSQVSGRVARVAVDFNSIVKKGDTLAEIDPVVFGAQVSQASAQLAAQRANRESAKASASAAKAAYDRVTKLHAQNLASQGDLDAALGQYEMARAQVASAEAQIEAIQAQLSQSRTNVAWTKIYSPVDGVVITRSIDPGSTVVASFQAPILFVLAQDLSKMRVMADVDEADVGKLGEGMVADAVVDAFPGESFRGKVGQVRYSPNTVQGVVTYSAVVEVDNPDEKLRPGMTATVTIRSRESLNILRVPNAALRYKPSPATGPNGKPLPQTPEPALGRGEGRVYAVMVDEPGKEKVEPRVLHVGVSDGIYTEVVDGLPSGAKVVIDEVDDDSKKRGKVL